MKKSISKLSIKNIIDYECNIYKIGSIVKSI